MKIPKGREHCRVLVDSLCTEQMYPQLPSQLFNWGIGYVNNKAMEGTVLAHVTGNVPNLRIDIEKLDEEHMGELIYFFEKACAISGGILGVDPFNQPGVEEYKKNMFKLLKKPGY